MTLTKIDMAPTIKRIRQSRPYVAHPDTGQIYGFYSVMVKWADGTRKTFNSEEEANAYVEQRAINQDAVEKEVPDGMRDALAILNSYSQTDDDEAQPEADEFDVILVGHEDGKKIPLIKKIRELTGKGLRESKEAVTEVPTRLAEAIGREAAETMKKEIEAAGGKAEIK